MNPQNSVCARPFPSRELSRNRQHNQKEACCSDFKSHCCSCSLGAHFHFSSFSKPGTTPPDCTVHTFALPPTHELPAFHPSTARGFLVFFSSTSRCNRLPTAARRSRRDSFLPNHPASRLQRYSFKNSSTLACFWCRLLPPRHSLWNNNSNQFCVSHFPTCIVYIRDLQAQLRGRSPFYQDG